MALYNNLNRHVSVQIYDLIYGIALSSAMTGDTMILENLNGSSAIRTEYTGHKTKGKHYCM